jgi:hypothetical protein
MKGKVIEEFGMHSVDVSYCNKKGIKDRGQKANELMRKDKRNMIRGCSRGSSSFCVLSFCDTN